MDLVQRGQLAPGATAATARAAILGDGVAVVVRAEADVEPGADARPRRRRAGRGSRAARRSGAARIASTLIQLQLSRMIMSSSAWSPTMKS